METVKSNEAVELPENGVKYLDKTVDCGKRHASFRQDFLVSTILVVAYLIETIVQIVLIVNCYRSLLLYHSATSSPNWLWILLIGWIVTSLLVTLLSIIWTFSKMDFEDKVFGQLLCYLMHLFLLGLVWRYFKIALAYEKADVREFFKLGTFRLFAQTLPLVAINLAYLINSSSQNHADNTMGWLIAGELCSSIICLSIHQVMKLKKNEPLEKPNSQSDHNHKPRLTSTVSGMEINVTISRILLLISRMIVVGLLVSLPSYWPMLVIVAHLLTTFMWTCSTTIIFNAQTNPSSTNTNNKCIAKNKNDVESNEWMNQDQGGGCSTSWEKNNVGRHVKNSLVSSYVLFWDVNVKMNSTSSDNGLSLWCLSLPVLLVLVENVAVLIFHLRQCQTTIFFVVVSGSCLSFGLLLFVLVAVWNKWENFSDSRDNKLKELPTIENFVQDPVLESVMIEKSTNLLANSIILDFENCCQLEVEDKNSVSTRGVMPFPQNFGNFGNLINPQTTSPNKVEDCTIPFNRGTSEVTNTHNYGRINESLMTAVKIQEPSMAANNDNWNEMDSRPLCSIPQNTLSSTSSRNTNTLSNLTLQTSPELPKSKTKSPHTIYPNSSSSPLVIRKASKIQLNQQKRQPSAFVTSQSHPHPPVPMEISFRGGTNRCPVDNSALPSSDNIYEKLIEDAYGILICEGEDSSRGQNQGKSENLIKHEVILGRGDQSAAVFRKKLRILCAKCLGNHDPLLSNCCMDFNGERGNIPLKNQNDLFRLNNKLDPNQQILLYIPRPFESPKVCSETTEYPTDTEFTCNLYDNEEDDDEMSNSDSSHFSTLHRVTYVNLPIQPQTSASLTPKAVSGSQFNNILTSSTASDTLFPSADVRKEFTGMEYVKAWLLMNDVTAKNILNIRTNSLNRGNGNRNNNKVSSKSKHILKSRFNASTNVVNPYRKNQPVFLQFKPPPMQKQHPDLKNCYSAITNNTSISHCHQSFKPQIISNGNANVYGSKKVSTVRSCNQFHPAPDHVFNELQHDLIETVV